MVHHRVCGIYYLCHRHRLDVLHQLCGHVHFHLRGCIPAGKKQHQVQRKQKAEKQDDIFKRMMSTKDKNETFTLLRQHVRETLSDYIDYTEKTYVQVTDGFINEDLKSLKKGMNSAEEKRKMLKKRRRKEILGLRRIPIALPSKKHMVPPWKQQLRTDALLPEAYLRALQGTR